MKERENVFDKISCIEDYSFTIDFWTSCQNRPYGVLTVYYIDSDYVTISPPSIKSMENVVYL